MKTNILKNTTELAKVFCERYIDEDSLAVDATCGNGNDTLFLAERTQKVYGFDIQSQAIENTKKRCAHLNNITLFQMSHAEMKDVISEPVDCVIFNFGYLPKADPTIITQPDSSIKAVQAAWDLLRKDGVLVLCCYVGHTGGQEETDVIDHWIQENQLSIDLTYRQDRPQSPILKIIKKDA